LRGRGVSPHALGRRVDASPRLGLGSPSSQSESWFINRAVDRGSRLGDSTLVTADNAVAQPRLRGLLAASTPWWPPGSAFGYHAQTFGFLLGETLQGARRASPY
jgi:hypothetical protein